MLSAHTNPVPAITGQQPSSERNEVPFDFNELFFSRTDPKGLILSGNSVFQRVSLYEWEELYRKPHNIIRHPDMPKAVFYQLWDFLKKGNPIGAYVKNRAKDGRHYWVFAVVFPVEGGYLSVRIKPGSDLFKTVQDVYTTHRNYEYESKADSKESARVLLDTLKNLGFSSYEYFMSVAAAKEIIARNEQLNRKTDPLISLFGELTGGAQAIMAEVKKFFVSYEENKYVPINLQIQSFQLGNRGKPIGVISGNYDIVSGEIKNAIVDFNNSAQEVFNTIFESQFFVCGTYLLQEMMEFYKQEDTTGENEKVKEMVHATEAARLIYLQKVKNGLKMIMNKIGIFQEDSRRMKMYASSLEVIRVMGKMDTARLHTSGMALNTLIDDLKLFQERIHDSLLRIEKINANMKYNIKKALKE